MPVHAKLGSETGLLHHILQLAGQGGLNRTCFTLLSGTDQRMRPKEALRWQKRIKLLLLYYLAAPKPLVPLSGEDAAAVAQAIFGAAPRPDCLCCGWMERLAADPDWPAQFYPDYRDLSRKLPNPSGMTTEAEVAELKVSHLKISFCDWMRTQFEARGIRGEELLVAFAKDILNPGSLVSRGKKHGISLEDFGVAMVRLRELRDITTQLSKLDLP
jgi:hypothetical protein